MLPQQLRQRGIYAAFCPGSALVSPSCSLHQELRVTFSSGGGQPEHGASSSAAQGRNTAVDTTQPVPGVPQGDGVATSGTIEASAKPSLGTATAMAELRSRLAASRAAPELSRNAPGAPPSSHHSMQSGVSQPSPVRRQEAADFQGVPLQLGELGNPLQGMAVLTHTDVRQLAEYGKDPLASDQRFLASLQKMAPAPQQRAAAIMQMAAGAVPPPAVLVWAAQEVVAQVRLLLRERLLQPQQGEQGGQQQVAVQGSSGLAALRSEPWWEGALQLARLTLGGNVPQSSPQQQQQQQHPAAGQPPPPRARTELELMRAFAAGRAASGTPAGAPEAPQAGELHVGSCSWEALLALPQLHALLEAAASRSPELAGVLELAGVRTVGGIAPVAAAVTGSAAPGMSTAGGSRSGGGADKGKQRLKAPVATAADAEASPAPAAGPWLLPVLRSAVAGARVKALQAAGWADADAPLDVDAALTALALGSPGPGDAAGAPTRQQRVAAADWLAALTLLRHAEERLGCAGGASDVRQEAVAILHLLGLPLEPHELPYMDELKVSEQEVLAWQSQLSEQLTSGNAPAGGSAPPVPAALQSRLSAARQRLAAAGRALALAAPEPAASAPSWTPAAEATLAWLHAVGAPLALGLLSGGYGSLSRLRAMVPELREALVLRLLEMGRVQGGTTALAAALYGDTEAAWRAARADVAGSATAAALLHREAVEAELDLLHERYVATPAGPPVPQPLPTDAALAAAVQALPPPARLLYDSYYVLRADGGDDPAVVQERRRVADALSAAGEGAVLAGLGNLQAWLSEARKGLLLLPAPLLALLLRFLRVQVSVTREEAQSQRNKLTALAILVAEQQRRAVAAAGGGSDADGAAVATAARELAEWSRSGDGAATEAGSSVSAALAALLGPSAAMDFTSWLQATALSSSSAPGSTHALLAQQHMQMDVERYLTMTHDPRLHLPVSGLGQAAEASPSSSSSSSSASASSSSASCRPTTAHWTDPALRLSEASFLGDMRPQLDAYLQALGHRPLGEAEWTVYRDAALEEWEAGRAEREERVAAAGQSGFFNPRADEVYLQQMLERGIPTGDPLGPQSRRYLDTLLRNSSWSFAQRRQAVQRLIQLNAHFARQPPAPEGGSPFAPLFAVGGPDLVPRLGPLAEGQGQGQAVPGRREGATAAIGEAVRLPKGF
ncbi:hypothetical protein PLESTF_001951200 [Pleodorina starrii]|nr:hypothetical protein PLESTF_001951200 [Pleodorina starrii]